MHRLATGLFGGRPRLCVAVAVWAASLRVPERVIMRR